MDIRVINLLDIYKFISSLPSSLVPKTKKNKLNFLQMFFKGVIVLSLGIGAVSINDLIEMEHI
jgi:hypothetical protein